MGRMEGRERNRKLCTHRSFCKLELTVASALCKCILFSDCFTFRSISDTIHTLDRILHKLCCDHNAIELRHCVACEIHQFFWLMRLLFISAVTASVLVVKITLVNHLNAVLCKMCRRYAVTFVQNSIKMLSLIHI